jgi:Spy/CpxP family protein refolding chaperone
MISKRIALAAAVLIVAGVAVTIAQPAPDALEIAGMEAPAFFADAGLGGPGPGGPPPVGGPGHRGPGFPDPHRLAAYLDLTDEQRSAARDLLRQRRDSMRPLLERQGELRAELETTLDDATATDAALGQLVKQLHANRQAIKAARIELRAQLATLLDPAQKAKLEQLETVMEGLRSAGERRRGR